MGGLQYMTKEISELVSKLQQSLPYFERISEIVTQKKRLEQQIKADPYIGGRVVFAVFVSFFGGIANIIILAVTLDTVYHQNVPDILNSVPMVVILGYVISISFVLIVLAILKRRRKKKKMYLAQQVMLIDEEIRSIFQEHGEIMCVLPEPYRYYTAVHYIQQTLVHGRADSLKEAMNLYEDQMHKWKIENNQQYLIKVMQQQNETLVAMK